MPPRSLAVLVAALLAAPPLAPAPQATASPDLERGIRQAQEGEFERAVITLDGVVRTLKGRDGASKSLSRAYVYLAVSYLGLGQEPAARGSFLEALRIDPALELSSKEYPPRIVKLFEETRRSAAASLPPPPTTSAPPPQQPATTTPPAEKKGGSKTPLILLGVGGAAAAGVAVAASGGGSSSPSSSPTPTPTNTSPVASSIILTELSPPSGSSLIIPLDPPYYGSQIPRSSNILRVGLSITVAEAVSRGSLGMQLVCGASVCGFNLPDYQSFAFAAGQTVSYTVTGMQLATPPFDVTAVRAMLIQAGKTITWDPPAADIIVEATFPVSYHVRN
jgi:hypothetical protein